MASPMERDQGDDEILMSSKVSFSSTLYEQSFSTATEDGLLRGDCQYKMILWNWPKKTWMSYYVLNSWRVAAIAVDLPHSYLLALHQKRAQGFSSEVDILESICHIFFQRQVCIWNKCTCMWSFFQDILNFWTYHSSALPAAKGPFNIEQPLSGTSCSLRSNLAHPWRNSSVHSGKSFLMTALFN